MKTINRGNRALLLLLTGLLLATAVGSLQAQSSATPVVVTTNVLPPYDPDLSVWEQNPQRMLVTLRNTDLWTSYTVRLGGSLKSGDGGVVVTLNNTFAATPITISPGGTRVLNARQTGLLDPAAVTVSGADRDQIQRTRRLPEGSYTACLQALDFETLAPLSAPEPSGCGRFSIVEPEVPRPIFPNCGMIVDALATQNVSFSWTRPQVGPGATLTYELMIVPIVEGRSAQDAIYSATTPLFFHRKNLAVNSYTYGLADPKLEVGRSYAWRVRAQGANGDVVFPNDGWSEVCSFTYGRPEVIVDTTDSRDGDGDDEEEEKEEDGAAECFVIKAVTPTDGGVWSTDLKPRFEISLDREINSKEITGGTLEIWSVEGELGGDGGASSSPVDSWEVPNPGFLRPISGVTFGGNQVYAVQLLYYAVMDLDRSIGEWTAESGKTYAWRIRVDFDGNQESIREDGVACEVNSVYSDLFTFRTATTEVAVADSTCLILTPETPAHNSSITTDSPIFTVSSLPPIDTNGIDWVELKVWNMAGPGESPGTVSGRAPTFVRRIEVDRGSAEGFGSTYTPGNAFSYLVISDTDKEVDGERFRPAVDSFYLWQVSVRRRSGESIRIDGNECEGAPEVLTSSFGIFYRKAAKEERGDGPCPDSCSVPSPLNRSLRTIEFAVGDSVRIGKFTLQLTEVLRGEPSALTGKGKVHIPWLKSAVSVEFSSLQVNDNDEVFSGVVNAQEASTVSLPSALRGIRSEWTQEAITTGFDVATSAARMIKSLRSGGSVALPIGVQSNDLGDGGSASGDRLAIGITDMVFTPEGAELTALAKVPLPFLGADRGLGFGLRNLCFTPTSFTNGVEKNVFLATDAGYRDGDEWGFKVLAPKREGGAMTDSGTYISWDCNGITAFRVAAAVELPRSMVVPIDEDGEVDPDITRLVTARADFLWRRYSSSTSPTDTVAEGRITSSGFHVIANGSIDRFAPTSAPDLEVSVESIAFDWSDFENPTEMTFPVDYSGEQSAMWRGFYMRGASVSLPRAISRAGKSDPVTIGADYVMIDNAGLSFSAYAINLLGLRDGRAAGWGFSLDTARLVLVNNTPRELSLVGDVNVPVFSQGGVAYTGTLQYSKNGSSGSTPAFYLTLSTEAGVDLPMWSARASLGGNATVSLEKRESTGWTAGLELNADMNFTSSGGGSTTESPPAMKLAGISVKGFKVESVKPYLISTGDWYLGGQKVSSAGADLGTPAEEPTTGDGPSVEGFPLSISNITPVSGKDENEVGLKFNVNLHLLPSAGAALSGMTTIGLYGRMETGGAFGQSFGFSRFAIEKIMLDAEFGKVATVQGGVEFYRNDPDYGSGFYGAVDVNILNKIRTKVAGQFGSKGNHRYGFVDFSTLFKPGIPLGSTGVSFYGGGGGIWIGMSRSGRDPAMPVSAITSPEGFTIGKSLSGYRYKPDPNTRFGARIMLTLGANKPEMFNADMALEIAVNNSWGIDSVTLSGEGYGMMKDFPAGRDDARLTLRGRINYTPDTRVFHGTLGARINQADVLFIDGDLTLHADPNKWYVTLGTPSSPVTATLKPFGHVGGFYFMFGSQLPKAPAAPDSIPGEPRFRDFSVTNGNGFVLGAKGHFETGKQRFLIFTGEASASFGFEVSVTHNPGQTCEGAESSVGINGWYGNMMLWAGGSVAVDVDLGDLGSFNLATVSLKAWLTAGAPNPTWYKGGVQGEYSVMGGLIDGDFDWQFSEGTECHVPERSLDDLQLITDISPKNGSRDVSVLANATAAFSIPVREAFEAHISGVNGNFRVNVDRFDLIGPEGRENGSVALIDNRAGAKLTPDRLLLDHVDYEIVVRAVIQKEEGGVWRDFESSPGKLLFEERTVKIRTGPRPNSIPEQNIAYTWPITNQKYFMKEDGPFDHGDNLIGSILLFKEQDYLFESPDGSTRRSYVRLSNKKSGRDVILKPTFDSFDHRIIEFRIRRDELELGTEYTVSLFTQDSLHGGGTITTEKRSRDLLDGAVTSATARTTSRSLLGVEERPGYLSEPKELVAFNFATSWYSRMREKLVDTKVTGYSEHGATHDLYYTLMAGKEGFENYDVEGYSPSEDGAIATRFTIYKRMKFKELRRTLLNSVSLYKDKRQDNFDYWNKVFNISWACYRIQQFSGLGERGHPESVAMFNDFTAMGNKFRNHKGADAAKWFSKNIVEMYVSGQNSYANGTPLMIRLKHKNYAESDRRLLKELQELYEKWRVLRLTWPNGSGSFTRIHHCFENSPPSIKAHDFPSPTPFTIIPVVGIGSIHQEEVQIDF